LCCVDSPKWSREEGIWAIRSNDFIVEETPIFVLCYELFIVIVGA
jgi:hypothetical protein